MDWIHFLNSHNIEYVESGPNTKRGEVSVRCPWCGGDDPSHHLGISLTREVWGCHRNAEHRGKSPTWLIQGLLGCSRTQATLIFKQHSHSDPEGLDEALKMLTETPAPKVFDFKPYQDDWNTFKPFTADDRFGKYLKNRGFGGFGGFEYINDIIAKFDLRYATTGRFANRILFPLHLNGLIGWTGRAIVNPAWAPRYLTTEHAKATVYGYEFAKDGGGLLYIVEGPMDALKINSFALSEQCSDVVRAVAIMGTSLSVGQFALLKALSHKFEKKVRIMFDNDAVPQMLQVAEDLQIKWQLAWASDPGAMTYEQIAYMIESDILPF